MSIQLKYREHYCGCNFHCLIEIAGTSYPPILGICIVPGSSRYLTMFISHPSSLLHHPTATPILAVYDIAYYCFRSNEIYLCAGLFTISILLILHVLSTT